MGLKTGLCLVGTLTFTPTVKDEFRGSSQITRARFVRNAAGDITEVLVSARRALNSRFVKLDRLRPPGPTGS